MRPGPALVVVLTLATVLGACRKEQGVETGSSLPAGKPAPIDSGAAPGVAPGIAPQAEIGAKTNPYTGDTHAVAVGRQLFTGFNCAGCHSGYAGGGMGPNLRDSVWIYGGSDVQLYSTITEGRPNGMPAWGGKIPPQQIWQIIAYIRTLGTPQEPVMPPSPKEGG
jgi:cytochrome c oxidase cbb3-type subunit III